MKSINNLAGFPAGISLLADNILEFHAARILLLVRYSGVKGRIDGLTKLAKLDFFVRYPKFFATICSSLGRATHTESDTLESAMIRYHYAQKIHYTALNGMPNWRLAR